MYYKIFVCKLKNDKKFQKFKSVWNLKKIENKKEEKVS